MKFISISLILVAVISFSNRDVHAGRLKPLTALDEGFGGDSTGVMDSVTVVPGGQYTAGWLHRLLFGSHWRDMWTTALRVPILDLRSYAGGLTAIKRGGGQQTASLRFLGADGRQYKFRSMQKDPAKVLPAQLRNTLVSDVLQDQISSSNPLAALIVVPALESVDVLQVKPMLCVLPDDARLGEFRKDFAGMPGMIEEHPDENSAEELAFAGAEKVSGTFNMFDDVEADPRNQPDAREYLKARLMDFFLGDWDRHYDQWRWAAYTQRDTVYWRPIPRDRDQAFARFNGLLPWLASMIVPQLNHFGGSYQSVQSLSWSGRFLDRRILPRLRRQEWDSVTAWTCAQLSDSVLSEAVHRLPPDHYAIAGKEFFAALQQRREKLPALSSEWYFFLAEQVDLYGSTGDDIAAIERRADGSVRVRLMLRKSGATYYERTFSRDETADIRVYLLGGDDSSIVRGSSASSIAVRIIGGEGCDAYTDSGSVSGWALGIIPFVNVPSTYTYFCDPGKKSRFTAGRLTSVDISEPPGPKTKEEYYSPPRDWGRDHLHIPMLWYSSDLGFIVSYHFNKEVYGFRAFPFLYSYNIGADASPQEGKFRISGRGAFSSIIPGAKSVLFVEYSSMDAVHYYGFGNETTHDEALDDAGYYDIDQMQLKFELGAERALSSSATFTAMASMKHIANHPEPGRLVNDADLLGMNHYTSMSLRFSLRYDTRDYILNPYKGIYTTFDAEWYPGIFDNEESFGRAAGDVRAYWTSRVVTPVTFAVRGFAERVLYRSEFPFFASAVVGGKRSLRGYNLGRFIGDGAYGGGADVRIQIGTTRILIPVTIGIDGFYEAGRVTMRGERSAVWHTGTGGGIWAAIADRSATLSLTIGVSEEKTGYYASIGFPW